MQVKFKDRHKQNIAFDRQQKYRSISLLLFLLLVSCRESLISLLTFFIVFAYKGPKRVHSLKLNHQKTKYRVCIHRFCPWVALNVSRDHVCWWHYEGKHIIVVNYIKMWRVYELRLRETLKITHWYSRYILLHFYLLTLIDRNKIYIYAIFSGSMFNPILLFFPNTNENTIIICLLKHSLHYIFIHKTRSSFENMYIYT